MAIQAFRSNAFSLGFVSHVFWVAWVLFVLQSTDENVCAALSLYVLS